MKRAALFATALAVATGLSVQPAASQALPCKHWREIACDLGSRYAERPVAFGLQSNGNLLQVFASEATGTWTLVTMRPDGMACLIGAGKSREALPRPSTDPQA